MEFEEGRMDGWKEEGAKASICLTHGGGARRKSPREAVIGFGGE